MESPLVQDPKTKKQSKLPKIFLWVAGIILVICGLVAFGVLYNFGRSYFGPKTQLILEPDYSLVSSVDPSDLERSAQILNARCLAIGCGFSFAIAENNQIIAEVPGSINPSDSIGYTIWVGLLELVDFGETPIPEGTKIATDFYYQYLQQVDGPKWHTIITNSDFSSATVTQDKFGHYQVSFTLTPNGTKILSDYTTNNVGHYLGIVLDKAVITSPKIVSPITDGIGVINGNFTQETANALAVTLRTEGPLPIPLVVKQVSENGE